MHRRWPLLLGLIAGLLALAAGLALGTDPADGWGKAARWTARVGLPVFLTAYAASSLARLWPGAVTRAILRDRRWWGLGFAACHTVHLVALVFAVQSNPEPRSFVSLLPGGFGYAVLFALALTSNDAAMRALGRGWKRLHTAGIHVLWLIYTLAYAGRLDNPDTRIEGNYGIVLCLAALSLRLAAMAKRRRAAA